MMSLQRANGKPRDAIATGRANRPWHRVVSSVHPIAFDLRGEIATVCNAGRALVFWLVTQRSGSVAHTSPLNTERSQPHRSAIEIADVSGVYAARDNLPAGNQWFVFLMSSMFCTVMAIRCHVCVVHFRLNYYVMPVPLPLSSGPVFQVRHDKVAGAIIYEKGSPVRSGLPGVC